MARIRLLSLLPRRFQHKQLLPVGELARRCAPKAFADQPVGVYPMWQPPWRRTRLKLGPSCPAHASEQNLAVQEYRWLLQHDPARFRLAVVYAGVSGDLGAGGAGWPGRVCGAAAGLRAPPEVVNSGTVAQCWSSWRRCGARCWCHSSCTKAPIADGQALSGAACARAA